LHDPAREGGAARVCVAVTVDGTGRPVGRAGGFTDRPMASYDAGAAGALEADPSQASADHLPVKKLSIGSWNLLAKYDEHVLLSFYWSERKLVWEVLHLGVVRKMEVDFEDISQATLTNAGGAEQQDRLVLELHRPPRFFKENPPSAVSAGAQEVNYVYTTDFTNGQASTESRHVLLFDAGAITREHTKMINYSGIRLVVEGSSADPKSSAGGTGRGGLGRALGGVHATSAHLRQPPTSSPRLDAIILQDQLKREMRERQARYTGICPVRERIYASAFDELIAAVARDAPKRGSLLTRLYAESRMTIDAYKSVFENSIEFGGRKLNEAIVTKGDLAQQVEDLEAEIAEQHRSIDKLTSLCESLEAREEAKAAVYEEVDKEITDLQAEQQQLEDLLAVLKLSKPDKKEGR